MNYNLQKRWKNALDRQVKAAKRLYNAIRVSNNSLYHNRRITFYKLTSQWPPGRVRNALNLARAKQYKTLVRRELGKK